MTMNTNNKVHWIAGALLAPIVLATFGIFGRQVLENTAGVGTLQGEFREIKYRLREIDRKMDLLLERNP